MRLSDPVSTRAVVHIALLFGFAVCLLVLTHTLRRPGLALLMLAAYVVARIVWVRSRRAT